MATHYRFGDSRIEEQIISDIKASNQRLDELEARRAEGAEGWSESDQNEYAAAEEESLALRLELDALRASKRPRRRDSPRVR
ncbi:MAG: hypothetical protein R3B96_19010 [Pirellulaceae bacterium]